MAELMSYDPARAMREMHRLTMEEANGRAPWQLARTAQAAKRKRKAKRPTKRSKRHELFSGHRPSHVDVAALIRRQQDDLTLLTQALCRILKKQPQLAKENRELKKWWRRHQAWDQKRARKK